LNAVARVVTYVGALFLTAVLFGCGPGLGQPLDICPGAGSLDEAVASLEAQQRAVAPFKATGRCRLDYVTPDEKGKESFAVKMWVNPPGQLRFWGDVAFNARGIDLGTNGDEFWLAAKPREIGNTFYWGKWSEQGDVRRLLLSPELVLESLGIVRIDRSENWKLSNEGVFDVLTLVDEAGRSLKKIYIYCCDYRVRKIEYFDQTGETVVREELEYRKDFAGLSVPSVINIVTHQAEDEEYSFRIRLDSVRPFEFTPKRIDVIFGKPEPKGFNRIVRIAGDRSYEESTQ